MKRIILFLLIFLMIGSAALAEPEMTLYFQNDYPDVLINIKGEDKSIASSGCWACCLASLMSYYLPEDAEKPGPEEIFLWAAENQLYNGNGMSIYKMQTVIEHYGLKTTVCNVWDYRAKDLLKNNGPFILYVGNGYFTTKGHYIIVNELQEDDETKVSVIDPNSRKKSRVYKLKAILQQKGLSQSCLLIQGENYTELPQ